MGKKARLDHLVGYHRSSHPFSSFLGRIIERNGKMRKKTTLQTVSGRPYDYYRRSKRIRNGSVFVPKKETPFEIQQFLYNKLKSIPNFRYVVRGGVRTANGRYVLDIALFSKKGNLMKIIAVRGRKDREEDPGKYELHEYCEDVVIVRTMSYANSVFSSVLSTNKELQSFLVDRRSS